ncbi:lipase family protein [Aquihabitans sp. G128]|uniref:lipase family protein n=1 Tax=Aquihabitans sp. G128 TaxID=2849779 RepID=UPI001C216900|nr:lipase family protein [Aquihabitans sp. G128]QXC61431.1 lipase family protein [Aquihabitans sp. G128]
MLPDTPGHLRLAHPSRRSRPVRAAAGLAVAFALVVAGCSGSSSDAGSDGTSTTTSTAPSSSSTGRSTTSTTAPAALEPFTGSDFYAPPDPLPTGDHGTLVRYQPVTPTVVAGADTYRIMYLSESLEGDAIAVTGTVLVPKAAAPEGGRPLLAVAHGTSGIADECAPSKAPAGELDLMADQVEAGWLIAATDYEGLGTPGRHPYLVGPSEGRGTLDAIVAAGALPAADPGSRLAIAGYSQGGHGALWAGQLAKSWTPDLELVGTFAGAPATEMGLILAGAPDGFKLMMIAGYAAAYPQADPSLYLTPKGVGLLDAVDKGCTRDVFRAVGGIPDAELLRADRAKAGPWTTLPRENDPGRAKVDDPILIIHSDQDDTVPVALSGRLFDRMCGLGQVVERRVLVGGGTHVGAAPEAFKQGLAWLEQRFEGSAEARSTCPGR